MMDLSEVRMDLGLAASDKLLDDDVEPQSFREAWDHPELEKRTKWREAIQKDFTDMNCRGIWRTIK